MKQNGFTLVELMVVIAIIGILTSVAIPNYTRMREQKYVSLLEASLLGMQRNVEAVKASFGGDSYPIHTSIINSPTSAAYTPCNTLAPDAAMLCSTLPVLPTNAPVAPNCVGGIWAIPTYAYISDGTNYKLILHCTGTAQAINNSRLRDPQRPTWALSVTNNPAATATW